MTLRHILMTLALACATTAWAETTDMRRHEIQLGLGTFSSTYIARGTGFNLDNYLRDKWFGADKQSGKYSMRNTMVFRAGYGYRVQDDWSITLDASRQNFKDNTDTGEIKTWLLGARHDLKKNGDIELYTGAAIGQAEYRFDTGRQDATHTAYQIDAIGLRYGQGPVSSHFVIGYGFAGLLQAGVNARF